MAKVIPEGVLPRSLAQSSSKAVVMGAHARSGTLTVLLDPSSSTTSDQINHPLHSALSLEPLQVGRSRHDIEVQVPILFVLRTSPVQQRLTIF